LFHRVTLISNKYVHTGVNMCARFFDSLRQLLTKSKVCISNRIIQTDKLLYNMAVTSADDFRLSTRCRFKWYRFWCDFDRASSL